MKPGKRFEEKFRESAEACGMVVRIPDKVGFANGRAFSEESEADFFVFTAEGSFLVECKAVNRGFLQFYNVKEHQEKALLEFDSVSESTHGILAVEFYDKEGYRKPKRMFMLPIDAWLRYKESSGRSSMTIDAFSKLGVECPYVGSRYLIDFGAWFR